MVRSLAQRVALPISVGKKRCKRRAAEHDMPDANV